jgi:zinc transporter ZupT
MPGKKREFSHSAEPHLIVPLFRDKHFTQYGSAITNRNNPQNQQFFERFLPAPFSRSKHVF